VRGKSGNLDRLRRMHLPLNGKTQSISTGTRRSRYIGRGDTERARSHVREHLLGTLNLLNALREKNLEGELPENFSLEADDGVW
jgi:hypothetical protein